MTAISSASTDAEKKQPSSALAEGHEFIGEPFDRVYVDSLGNLRNFEEKLS
jgi:hypothetical protein